MRPVSRAITCATLIVIGAAPTGANAWFTGSAGTFKPALDRPDRDLVLPLNGAVLYIEGYDDLEYGSEEIARLDAAHPDGTRVVWQFELVDERPFPEDSHRVTPVGGWQVGTYVVGPNGGDGSIERGDEILRVVDSIDDVAPVLGDAFWEGKDPEPGAGTVCGAPGFPDSAVIVSYTPADESTYIRWSTHKSGVELDTDFLGAKADRDYVSVPTNAGQLLDITLVAVDLAGNVSEPLLVEGARGCGACAGRVDGESGTPLVGLLALLLVGLRRRLCGASARRL